MSETYVPGADEECPSRCENTTVEEVEGQQLIGCLDCGSAGVLR